MSAVQPKNNESTHSPQVSRLVWVDILIWFGGIASSPAGTGKDISLNSNNIVIADCLSIIQM
jgi:hypothetical protein